MRRACRSGGGRPGLHVWRVREGESIYEYALSRAYSHQGVATDKFRENVALAIIKAIPSETGGV